MDRIDWTKRTIAARRCIFFIIIFSGATCRTFAEKLADPTFDIVDFSRANALRARNNLLDVRPFFIAFSCDAKSAVHGR